MVQNLNKIKINKQHCQIEAQQMTLFGVCGLLNLLKNSNISISISLAFYSVM